MFLSNVKNCGDIGRRRTLVWRREVDGDRQQISNGFETAFSRRRNNNSFSQVSSSLPADGLPEWKLFHSNFFLIA
jgi:hypothetical protein